MLVVMSTVFLHVVSIDTNRQILSAPDLSSSQCYYRCLAVTVRRRGGRPLRGLNA